MSNEQYLADRIALQDVMLKYAAGVDERDFDLYLQRWNYRKIFKK